VVKVSKNSPVWLIVSDLRETGILDLSLLLQKINGSLGRLINLASLTKVCFFLQLFHLIFKLSFFSKDCVLAVDNLDEILSLLGLALGGDSDA